MTMPMEVGHVHLDTSCAPAAAADIDRGVSLLYSFWYDDAGRRSFHTAEAEQPACAMAWWGEAMSEWQQIEALPEGAQLKTGQIAVAHAEGAAVKTAREGAYIDAVAIIFDPAAVITHPPSMFREIAAWTLFAQDHLDQAIALLRPLADELDLIGKGDVELPAREMIGDMLRLSGRPAEALVDYRLSLKTDPGRRSTLLSTDEAERMLALRQNSRTLGSAKTLLRRPQGPAS